MNYFLFTYPNCPICEDLKRYLNKKNLDWQEFNLVLREGKLKIREFIKDIRRDEKGSIIIPTLVVQEEEKVKAVLNSRQELEGWLKSRD